MQAVILCGGLGTRLRSSVSEVPKSMAPIGGRPFLMYQINWLKKHNITNLILCVGYLKEHIKNYFGDGSVFGVNITYAEEEEELLGTAGALKNAQSFVTSSFIVLNGDTYAKIDFDKLVQFHQLKESKFTIGVTEVEESSRYGTVCLDENQVVTKFLEKGTDNKGYINGGVYVLEPEIFDYIPAGKKMSLEQEVFPLLVEKGLHGHVWDGSFIDIGLPESYSQLKSDILESLFVNKEDSIKEVMKRMDSGAMGIALVVDENRRLEGLVTDGDVRRYIIKDEDIRMPISMAMIKNPVTAKVGSSNEEILQLVNPRIKHIPLVDQNGVVRDIVLSADLRNKQKEKMVVRAKSPLRISFAGGGTDIYYFFKDFGGYVLNCSIDKYCRGTLVKRTDKIIHIESSDFDIHEDIDNIDCINYNGKLALIKAVIKLMKPSYGFNLYLHSDVPPGTGLGSSAAIASVVVNLLNYLREEKLDDYQLSELIYNAEREEIKIEGGWQDQYATVFGGFNFMEFDKNEIIVHPLRISNEILEELNSNLFLWYTGATRHSGDIQSNLVKKQDKDSAERDDDVIKALAKLKDITLRMRSALLKGKMEEFGHLLHESWENKKRTNSLISNSSIDSLYEIGIRNGALGGKILGAGGGGYLLFFCPPVKKKKVIAELQKASGELVNFNFDGKGAVHWMARK